MDNSQILEKLIEEDFGIRRTGDWGKSIEHSSLVLDYGKGIYFWNSKEQVGDPLSYLVNVRGYTFSHANSYLEALKNGKILYNVQQRNPEAFVSTVPYTELTHVQWRNGVNNREYWYDRCLTDETIDRFMLGYWNGWYTIPITENGNLLQIQMRRDNPEKRIKLWYRNVPLKIFNADILPFSKTIFMAEGVVDAILLNQYGIPAIAKVSGAGSWNKAWFSKFLEAEKIYIIYDNDEAGRKGAVKTAKNIDMYRCKIYTFDGFRDKYDIVDWFRDGNSADDLLELVMKESKRPFELKEFHND